MPSANDKYYIAPNSDIRVLRGIPLDSDYEHTIAWGDTFDARKRQEQYFLSKTKYYFGKQTYQRSNRGYIRVGQPTYVEPSNPVTDRSYLCADDFYDCNYMMFRNTSFGDKWFYAFITSVDYINDNTTEIHYEIDVMQTWLRGVYLDYDPEPCFVERMHVADDSLFENTVPEDITFANEYVQKKSEFIDLSETMIVVLSGGVIKENPGFTFDLFEWESVPGEVVNGVYGKLHLAAFNNTPGGIYKCNEYLQQYINEGMENDIIAIYMVPYDFVRGVADGKSVFKWQTTFPAPKAGYSLGTIDKPYTPRNNKLYSYPYNRLRITNHVNQEKEFKWELFSNPQTAGKFEMYGKLAWNPCAMLTPIDYKGFKKAKAQAYNINGYEPLLDFDNSLLIEEFPIGAWSGDAFKAWWAQNSGNVGASISSALGSLALAGAAIATGGIGAIPAGVIASTGAVSAATSLTKTAASIQGAKHVAPEKHGDFKDTNMGAATRNIGFAIYYESYRSEMLKLIDDYFTKYGYAIKDVRKPGWLNRERWTYVKTIGFNMTGELNQSDMRKICEIYDNGITFWKNPNDVGNYELSNKPIV